MRSLLSLLALAPALAVAEPIKHTARANWLSYSPIDHQADTGARALLNYLQSTYGNHYLSGQMDKNDVAWVKSHTGKTPAIQGNDFMDYSPSRVAYGASSSSAEEAIAFDKAGGINTVVWHWNAPTCLYNSASQPWYKGFYTSATCFDVQQAMNEGPGGSNYQLILRDIDAIAVQLQKLASAGVPVLWRPLHEPEGGWFWWGAKGSGPFKQLWDLMYQRLTQYHNLHNLIWVCNTAASDWYPGNSKCDIATVDVYASPGDHGPLHDQWNTLYGLTNGARILALAEVGDIPDPSQMTSSGALWAYWMTWSGSFIEDGSYNSVSYIQQVYGDSKVITVDGPSPLGSWKQGSTGSSGSGSSTTTTTTQTKPTTTTTSASSGSTGSLAAQFGQCGGQGWTGPTACVSPYTCQVQNQYYSQCL
ncbi:Mannan endo-1,4-beta-mannosidase [Penicillium ucsense]|uniref:Mannan endo-1,4-beta-mannosidase n=1 Tax=Penicillium ucsense TaxID=2839758 RepID=A0A8J8VWC1_9EURO|nr:Mannan endo-1,4-beta-mannosidase [Penicillium ucsense]KAF7730106.1 Mannan endo-1,4-beta-mannosidase [Penicillium ucsense]